MSVLGKYRARGMVWCGKGDMDGDTMQGMGSIAKGLCHSVISVTENSLYMGYGSHMRKDKSGQGMREYLWACVDLAQYLLPSMVLGASLLCVWLIPVMRFK